MRRAAAEGEKIQRRVTSINKKKDNIARKQTKSQAKTKALQDDKKWYEDQISTAIQESSYHDYGDWSCAGGCGMNWEGWNKLEVASNTMLRRGKATKYTWLNCKNNDVSWCPVCKLKRDDVKGHEKKCRLNKTKKRKRP